MTPPASPVTARTRATRRARTVSPRDSRLARPSSAASDTVKTSCAPRIRHSTSTWNSTASGCYETAVIGRAPDTSARMERIAFVTGLRKGQSYLYWHADRLYQLPSYADGRPNFERPIPPRCLECHATAFESLPDPVLVNRYRPTGARLGISCETCHGAGREHVGRERSPLRAVLPPAIVNPARLPRERQLRRLRPLSQWDRPASNRAILVCAWAAPREAIHPLRGTGYDPTRRAR